jgi:hypothetical protein
MQPPIPLAYRAAADEMLRIIETEDQLECVATARCGTGPRGWIVGGVVLVLLPIAGLATAVAIRYGIRFGWEWSFKPLAFALSIACFILAALVVLMRRRQNREVALSLVVRGHQIISTDPTRVPVTIVFPALNVRGFRIERRGRDLSGREIADLHIVLQDRTTRALFRRVDHAELNALYLRLCGRRPGGRLLARDPFAA